MNYGTNLTLCLKKLQLTNKEAAHKIGISCNTLSNILNNRFSPSKDTHNKILSFLTANGFSKEDFMKEEIIFKNFLLYSSRELSGIEKSQFRNEFYKFIELLKRSDSSKHIWIDYFDYIDMPTEYYEQETLWERRELLTEKLKGNKNTDIFSAVSRYFKNIYEGQISTDLKSPVDIRYLLDSLGIRRFFIPFTTEKVSSFSTGFTFTEAEKSNPDFEQDPLIVINEKVCNTTEKCLFEMARQFYYLITDKRYLESINDINIEDEKEKQKAEIFAENIMIGINELKSFIAEKRPYLPAISLPVKKSDKEIFLRNYDFSYIVNEIKRVFRVGDKLAIKKLFEIKFEYCIFFDSIEEAESFYFDCLKRFNDNYKNKPINGEPESLPTSFRGEDFGTDKFLDISSELSSLV